MKTIIVLMLLIFPVNALADCQQYEYAEVKDMTKDEHRKAITETTKSFEALFASSTKSLEADNMISYRRKQSLEDQCMKQMDQLKRVWDKKYPGIPVAETTK